MIGGTSMDLRKISYKQLSFYLSIAVIANAVLFFIYMICAGVGVAWAKIFLAIVCLLLSVATLAALYFKKELLRPRSLWMTLAAGAVLILLLFSLILNFPSPRPVATLAQYAVTALDQIVM